MGSNLTRRSVLTAASGVFGAADIDRLAAPPPTP